MVIFFLNLVLWAITTLLNIITWLIFNTAAHLLVLAIRGCKIPGQAIQGALEQLGNVIRTCLVYLLELSMNSMMAFVSSLFDAMKQGITDSATGAGSALGSLMEEMRGSLENLIKEIAPQVIEGFTDLITNVVVNLWNSYKEAVAYVLENM
ncbi:OLC1v1006688C1 [Oldenlandia corymbosa var. corymbosa]|uniref:OLC1v1006688C1 n=1 Tax=Oldenlandia corymbosa var. corymbosa TaxID=529605 RepID=A0AAV1DKN3_OLDCO|nr:OLC1v1006688C1 [Oldenlandia corymbosa var. corymbosa]